MGPLIIRPGGVRRFGLCRCPYNNSPDNEHLPSQRAESPRWAFHCRFPFFCGSQLREPFNRAGTFGRRSEPASGGAWMPEAARGTRIPFFGSLGRQVPGRCPGAGPRRCKPGNRYPEFVSRPWAHASSGLCASCGCGRNGGRWRSGPLRIRVSVMGRQTSVSESTVRDRNLSGIRALIYLTLQGPVPIRH